MPDVWWLCSTQCYTSKGALNLFTIMINSLKVTILDLDLPKICNTVIWVNMENHSKIKKKIESHNLIIKEIS